MLINIFANEIEGRGFIILLILTQSLFTFIAFSSGLSPVPFDKVITIITHRMQHNFFHFSDYLPWWHSHDLAVVKEHLLHGATALGTGGTA